MDFFKIVKKPLLNETLLLMKRPASDQEKILAVYIADKEPNWEREHQETEVLEKWSLS